MSYFIRVGKYPTDGPDWWFNFLRATIPLISGKTWQELLDEHLRIYNATYISEVSSSAYVVFDSEQDAMMFILKWA